jgi:gas vesicle protein
MNIREEKSSTSSGWYLLGGLIVGAAAGLLLAPQSGVETREDIEAWRRRTATNARSFFARIGESLPESLKSATSGRSMKGAAKEAVAAARDGLKQFSGS